MGVPVAEKTAFGFNKKHYSIHKHIAYTFRTKRTS